MHRGGQLFFEVTVLKSATCCSTCVLPQDGHLAWCVDKSAMWRNSVNSFPQSRQTKT